MKYELLSSLGFDDARRCNKDFGASLEIESSKLAKGCIVELPDSAVAWLRDGKGYKALLEPAGKVKGVSQEATVKGA